MKSKLHVEHGNAEEKQGEQYTKSLHPCHLTTSSVLSHLYEWKSDSSIFILLNSTDILEKERNKVKHLKDRVG